MKKVSFLVLVLTILSINFGFSTNIGGAKVKGPQGFNVNVTVSAFPILYSTGYVTALNTDIDWDNTVIYFNMGNQNNGGDPWTFISNDSPYDGIVRVKVDFYKYEINGNFTHWVGYGSVDGTFNYYNSANIEISSIRLANDN